MDPNLPHLPKISKQHLQKLTKIWNQQKSNYKMFCRSRVILKNAIFGPNLPYLLKISTQQRLFYKILDCHVQKLFKIWTTQKVIIKNVDWTLSYTRKMPFWVQICLIYPIFGDWYIFSKKIKMASWLFCNNDHLTSCKKLKESDGQLLRKIHFRRVDRQMDKPCFIGLLSVKLGVQEVFVKLNQPHFF